MAITWVDSEPLTSGGTFFNVEIFRQLDALVESRYRAGQGEFASLPGYYYVRPPLSYNWDTVTLSSPDFARDVIQAFLQRAAETLNALCGNTNTGTFYCNSDGSTPYVGAGAGDSRLSWIANATNSYNTVHRWREVITLLRSTINGLRYVKARVPWNQRKFVCNTTKVYACGGEWDKNPANWPNTIKPFDSPAKSVTTISKSSDWKWSRQIYENVVHISAAADQVSDHDFVSFEDAQSDGWLNERIYDAVEDEIYHDGSENYWYELTFPISTNYWRVAPNTDYLTVTGGTLRMIDDDSATGVPAVFPTGHADRPRIFAALHEFGIGAASIGSTHAASIPAKSSVDYSVYLGQVSSADYTAGDLEITGNPCSTTLWSQENIRPSSLAPNPNTYDEYLIPISSTLSGSPPWYICFTRTIPDTDYTMAAGHWMGSDRWDTDTYYHESALARVTGGPRNLDVLVTGTVVDPDPEDY